MTNINKLIVSFAISLLFMSCATSKVASQENLPKIYYKLSMPEPHTHYFNVEMKIENCDKVAKDNKIFVKMPAWTPGSYLIREYAKNVESFEATTGNQKLPAKKISKNTWEVATNGKSQITVSYKVYAFELSVRTSFIDDTHGYLNGASVFMYLDELKNNAAELEIIPFEKWSKVSTALKEIKKNKFLVSDLDELIDSPIEIGNHETIEFEAMGIPHKIAMYSNRKLDYDKNKVIDAYQKVIKASANVVGEHPCKEYLFIVHHLPGIGGGLEHLNSTTCQTSPNAYTSEAAFTGFMGLIAHEYFHLWNVKRVRPIELGPFDYEKENYTHLLWVSEGITSFYQDILLRRANLLSEETYLAYMANDINSIENLAGNKVQSAAESSWDAWIKYYRPNENSNNATVSYYSKGGVLGMLLNLEIMGTTNAQKSLDDVFKLLWKEYYQKQNRGYTEDEFQKACETVAGKSLDSFFQKYVWSTESIDYAYFLNHAGLQLSDENQSSNLPYFGAKIQGTKVSFVERGSGAYEGGINVNDEIVEINGTKFTSASQLTEGKQVNDVVDVVVKRFGELFTYKIQLKRNPGVRYSIKKMDTVSEKQEKVYQKLMN